LEFLGGRQELLELFLVGLRPALLVGIAGGLLIVFEDIAQNLDLALFRALAQADDEIERYRRLEYFFLDFLFASFDPLGDLDLLLPRKELKVSHLLQVEAYRI